MIYFISDQHLGLGDSVTDKQRESMLLRFLAILEQQKNSSSKPHCERLFVLGDLFDYWFEYETVVQKQHIRTLAALASLVESGIPVDYLIGNHDFGHRSFFRNELGVNIHSGDLDITLHTKRFYLAHGDGKDLHDKKYLFIRSILRNPFAQWAWKWIHPDIGIGTAAYFSRKSRMNHKNTNLSSPKHLHEQRSLEILAEEKIKQGYDYVIMGHTHLADMKSFAGEQQNGTHYEGTYINTGSWLQERYQEPTFAVFDGVTMRLWSLSEWIKENGDHSNP